MGGRRVPPAGGTWSVCVEAMGVTPCLSVRWKDVLGMGEERRAPRWGAGRPAGQAEVRGDIPWDVCTPAGGVSPAQKHTPPLFGFQRPITGIGGPPHLTWCSSHVASGASAVFRKAEHLLASVSWAPSWTNGAPSLPLGIPLYPISVLGGLRVVSREPSHRSWVWGAGSMGGRAASGIRASRTSLLTEEDSRADCLRGTRRQKKPASRSARAGRASEPCREAGPRRRRKSIRLQ